MHEWSERRPWWQRTIGLALLAGAVIGGVLVLFGLYALVVSYGTLQEATLSQMDAFADALVATDEGLDLAGQTLGEVDITLGALDATVGGATRTVTNTLATLDTVADLSGGELPEAIRSTQSALGAARETARVIDRVLGTISGFGLLSSAAYNPEVPLNEAIGEVSASLDGLPASLEELEGGLRGSATNLTAVNGDLLALSGGVEAIGENLRETVTALDRSRQAIGELRSELGELRALLPRWFVVVRVSLFLGLIWLAIAQLNMALQGWELLHGRRAGALSVPHDD